MAMKRAEYLRAIVAHLPTVVTREYGQQDTCIPASYLAAELLRLRGIPCRLVVCDVIAGNMAWWDWIVGQADGPMPDSAWSVGVTHENPDKTGFTSHLIVRSKGKNLDCAAGQLSRPQKGISVPPGIMFTGNVWTRGDAVILYRPSPEPTPPMWVNAPEATSRIRARMMEVLGHENDDC